MNYGEAIKTLNTFRNAYYNYTENEEKKNVAQALDVVLPHNKKVEELLDLYRLQQEFKERYNTQVRVLDRQETLDDIREIAEEIYLKEKQLEEMK